jgi:hypothetical protein
MPLQLVQLIWNSILFDIQLCMVENMTASNEEM